VCDRPIDVVINNAALGSSTVANYTGVLHGAAAETASSGKTTYNTYVVTILAAVHLHVCVYQLK
jgi:hypothetical protein